MFDKLPSMKFPVAPDGEQSESFEVHRLCTATNDLVGPVVVGGLACADHFSCADALQAGTTEPYAYGKDKFASNDGDEDDKNQDLRPW
jgi:hypothetical protein